MATGHSDSNQENISASRFRFSLRARFILVISCVLILIFATLAFLLLRNARSSLTSDLNKNSVAFAELATRPIGDAFNVYKSYGSSRVNLEVKKFTSLNSTISNVNITSVEGKTLYNLGDDTGVRINTELAESFKPVKIKGTSGAYSEIVQPYFDANGRHLFGVAYTISTSNLEATIRKEFITIISLSLIGLMVAAGVTYFIINRFFLRPLESVSKASQAISRGQYTAQIRASRNDEIGDLANSVNHMATKLKNDIFELKEVDKMKNEFIMITSHNLRTPLTIMKGNVELLQDSELPKDVESMISRIGTGVKRLAALSEDILMIATIENEQLKISSKPVTLQDLFDEVRDTYLEPAQERGIKLDWEIEKPEAKVDVSATHIRSAVRNLIDNAIKFTDKGGLVKFSANLSGRDLIIEVKDNGIGIDPEEMKKLFTKFHRGTSTLNYNYEGTGIGLYSTKLIAQAHKGKVSAASTLGKGSTFTIYLPDVLESS